jgi:two-component sensor histidine kinase
LAQLSIDADPVSTHPDGAIAVGVIVNELVMNAFKYAYPKASGPIRVALKATGPDSAQVSVEDDGVGFNDHAHPASTGLGQRIIKAMANKLNGTIAHESGQPGCRITVSFPVVGKPLKSPMVGAA